MSRFAHSARAVSRIFSQRMIVLALAALALPACRLLRANDGPTVEPQSQEVLRSADKLPPAALGPTDVIEVRVFQEPDVSGTFRIGPDGGIDFPLCGKVVIGGLNAGQVADAIATCLRGKYLKSPQVSVLLREANSRKVFVFGEVQKPGSFAYEDGMSVVQALALAGGFTKIAAKNSCTVTRVVDGSERRIKVAVDDIAAGRSPTFTLIPGDILYVPESVF